MNGRRSSPNAYIYIYITGAGSRGGGLFPACRQVWQHAPRVVQQQHWNSAVNSAVLHGPPCTRPLCGESARPWRVAGVLAPRSPAQPLHSRRVEGECTHP
ncbi:uncharacterized protein DS421_19g665410 [Arachis hypogaea]|uniref:Uncharacterized protein n=1 Tax=Arachis hypogaea TaxID=3818 RepID=A0A6B9VFF8_ARAHY|nr:uncharacterized protein DS421_19g665410 [Arachis hypogaea]